MYIGVHFLEQVDVVKNAMRLYLLELGKIKIQGKIA